MVIGKPSPDGQIFLRRLTPAEACMAIITNSFALDPTNSQIAALKLKDASKLVASAPAYEIIYPRAYDQLMNVRNAILEIVESKKSSHDF